MTVSVFAPAFMQRGSEDIEIVSDGGGVPMNVTLPDTAPAVAGSTGLLTGASGAGAGFSLPPQAAAVSAATKAVKTRVRITLNYCRLGGRPARGLDLAEDAVLHPLLAPPVHRRHLLAADEHREVEVVAAGQPGHAAAPDHLPLFDAVAHLRVDRRQMPVERLNTHAVVDDHAVAVDAQIGGVHDDALLRRLDRHVGGYRQVEPEVHLLVHVLALIDVGARVGELRLHLRVAELLEGVHEHQLR